MNLSVPDPRRPRKLRRFADACRASSAAEQGERLREMRALTRSSLTPAMIEVMIAAQAFESLALALIGEQAAWMVSKGGQGSCLASVLLPGMEEETTCEGASPALALLGAWAMGAIGLCGQPPLAAPEPTLRPEGTLLN
jgi:hypothetical protein